MKRISYIKTWHFALIFTLVCSSFNYLVYSTLHPRGTPAGWESFFFSVGAGLSTLFSIRLCYLIVRKKENAMSPRLFYSLLFLLSFLLFPLVYGLYYGVLVNRLIYHGGVSIPLILQEVSLTIGLYHMPICMATILGLYNKKVFRLNQHIIEKEKMLSETRLVQLQQQVDPHFLFNNLNILSALIRQSPRQAELFAQRLSELYRYHLRSDRQQLVTLKDELQYANDYLYLLKCRYGNAFRLDMQEPDASFSEEWFIVTGTLQLLLENVVKHNAASAKQPVLIRMQIDAGILVMENEIRAREAVSEKIGLKNLEYRYQILTGKKIIYGAAGNTFRIQVPLIKQLKSIV